MASFKAHHLSECFSWNHKRRLTLQFWKQSQWTSYARNSKWVEEFKSYILKNMTTLSWWRKKFRILWSQESLIGEVRIRSQEDSMRGSWKASDQGLLMIFLCRKSLSRVRDHNQPSSWLSSHSTGMPLLSLEQGRKPWARPRWTDRVSSPSNLSLMNEPGRGRSVDSRNSFTGALGQVPNPESRTTRP